ncbi:MAG: V-type H+-transporting ATPase subunit E [Candidatus Saganbacteria bacterium]|uniref:V-type H+-transporting ATPase subunit E n=1 Tax=Candidatus Saganbacteria bacterium TaxID=2575572 RepID=A0A833L2A3_UNCSA|nr:MAG: V-type H+-transporting ATPase subunit E [Candidatus Saganbacteria bacterium]
MGIAEIKAKILEEAEIEAKQILEKAEAGAREIEREAKEKAEIITAKMLEEGKKKAEAFKRSIITPVRLEAKKKLLEEKHKILDTVFSGAPAETKEKYFIEAAKILYG